MSETVPRKKNSRRDPGPAGGRSAHGCGSDDFPRALRRAMDLLAGHPHSIFQMRVKLGRKFDPQVVEQVLDRLEEKGLLDDLEFAGEYARERTSRAPRGARLLVHELRRRGVPGNLAREAVGRFLDEQGLDEQQLAEQAAYKKIPKIRAADKKELELKLFRFLSGRGFPVGIARSAAENCLDRKDNNNNQLPEQD